MTLNTFITKYNGIKQEVKNECVIQAMLQVGVAPDKKTE